jgi:hypothetical protein
MFYARNFVHLDFLARISILSARKQCDTTSPACMASEQVDLLQNTKQQRFTYHEVLFRVCQDLRSFGRDGWISVFRRWPLPWVDLKAMPHR